MRNLCLLIVVPMTFACATSNPPLKKSVKPLLDQTLAAPCPIPSAPDKLDYDVWQLWVENELLRALGDCAIRHNKTVEAWPK